MAKLLKFWILDKCHVKLERHQSASKSKCFDTRFYRPSWACPQPKCGTSQMLMKYNMDMHLVLWRVYKPHPQFCRWPGPWGILLSNDWQEVALFKGTHPIKGPLDVICCKRRQQGSWNSMIHFHWSTHTLSPSFLSNLSVFWMKDFNFLKARAGFAPLLPFLYDS